VRPGQVAAAEVLSAQVIAGEIAARPRLFRGLRLSVRRHSELGQLRVFQERVAEIQLGPAVSAGRSDLAAERHQALPDRREGALEAAARLWLAAFAGLVNGALDVLVEMDALPGIDGISVVDAPVDVPPGGGVERAILLVEREGQWI